MTVFVLFGLHITRRNQLISLQLTIPQVEKRLRILRRENARLQEEILRSERPSILLKWLREPEYGHLRYPTTEERVILEDDL
ncbi:MAG: hypothetical protein WD595_05050 [Waddliaceae bacterium]